MDQPDLKTYTPEQLCKVYITMREDVERFDAEHEKRCEPHKTLMKSIEAEMLARSIREKTDSYATESGTVYKSRIKTIKVKDRGSFFPWLRAQAAEVQDAMLTAAVTKEAVFEFMKANAVEVDGKTVETVPPGLEVGGVVKMNFRK